MFSKSYTNQMVSSKPLALFRIIFGVLVGYQFLKLSKRISFFDLDSYLYIPFPGLEWLPVFPYPILLIILIMGFLCSVGITIGKFLKYNSLLGALCYGYLFLLDSVYYNNHYYLILLLLILMAFSKADSWWSLKKKKIQLIERWNYLIFQLQIFIVFFYGGLAKINADWISGKVMQSSGHSEFWTQFLTFGGLGFDLLVPFALLYRKTRWITFFFVALFNLINGNVFDDIGSFPILMTASLLLFMEGSGFPKWLQNWIGPSSEKEGNNLPAKYFLLTFFVFQLLFPLRHYLIPGNSEWTGQGHYFSWRMKSYAKDVKLKVFGYNASKNTRLFPVNHGIDDQKIQRVAAFPHSLPFIARNMQTLLGDKDENGNPIGISVDYEVSLNNRKHQMSVRPDIDISRVEYHTWSKNEWIIELNDDSE